MRYVYTLVAGLAVGVGLTFLYARKVIADANAALDKLKKGL